MSDGDAAVAETAGPDHDVRTYLHWGALAGLVVVAALATINFYVNATRAIGVWIAPRFEPAFLAAFNLALLLAAGVGISWLLDRHD